MRKWLVVSMSVIAVVLTGVMGVIYFLQDREGPEIIFESGKEDTYKENMTDEELLENVKAVDKVDGDVSDTLTIENVYMNEEGNETTVVYVAKDHSNNITKVSYRISSETDSSLAKDAGSGEEAEEEEEADSGQGNESGLSDEAQDTPQEAAGEEVMTEEEEAQKREEEKISQLNPQDPRFYLTTYYVKIARGTTIDKLSYVKSIEDDVDAATELYRKIQITGDVDVYTPGTYELTYFVVDSNGNTSNGAVLTIVVE